MQLWIMGCYDQIKSMSLNLMGKSINNMNTAIITGASAGIGASAAALFSQRNFKVINLSRRPCKVEGVLNLCGDLASEENLGNILPRLHEAVSKSNSVSLVHNAAKMRKDSVLDCSESELRAMLEINVVAINALNRRLITQMPKGSSVIYIGSTLSMKAVPNSFSYILSKHAQVGIMRATCQDLMGKGIHTALINPGFTDTEMLQKHLNNDTELIKSLAKMNSFERLANPKEIAECIVWAHHNPVINGTILEANLGQKES